MLLLLEDMKGLVRCSLVKFASKPPLWFAGSLSAPCCSQAQQLPTLSSRPCSVLAFIRTADTAASCMVNSM